MRIPRAQDDGPAVLPAGLAQGVEAFGHREHHSGARRGSTAPNTHASLWLPVRSPV